MPIKDPVKRAEYTAKYRASRREEAKKRSAEWYAKNKQRALERQAKYYVENHEERLAYAQEQRKDPEYRAKRKTWHATSYVKNHDRHICHDRFKKAVKKGWLVSKPCQVCGDPNSQGHHEDYSKPYEVLWFCDYHHKEHEGKIVVPRVRESESLSGTAVSQ